MVTESQLATCTVRTNGEFGTADRIRKGNYQALIVPYAPDISRNVLLFIEKLVQKEGRVFFVEEAPHGTIEDELLRQCLTNRKNCWRTAQGHWGFKRGLFR